MDFDSATSPNSQNANEIRSRDDECLVGLEVAHEHRRIVRRDHRRQEVDGRRDVNERKRRLHRLDRPLRAATLAAMDRNAAGNAAVLLPTAALLWSESTERLKIRGALICGCVFRTRRLPKDGEFEFDNSSDTVASVAVEMVTELELSPEDVDAVALAMRQEIASLSANMEGQASSSLEAAAELLQQGLRENALLAANSTDGPMPMPELPSHVVPLASVPELPLQEAPQQLQQPTAAVTLLRSVGSASSVHSETSMTSAHSVHSVQSSPAQLNGPSESANQQQRSVSPLQPSANHRLPRTSSVDRVAFRPAALSSSREGGTPVSLDRTHSDAMSPHNNSGLLSPDLAERRDLDKRSLNKLFENLQEVAREREGAVTPPPGSRPPLPPISNGMSSRQLAACKSSPPRVGWGIAALAAAPEPPPISAIANGNGNGCVSYTDAEQMMLCSEARDAAGIQLPCDVVGLIGAKKPPVKGMSFLFSALMSLKMCSHFLFFCMPFLCLIIDTANSVLYISSLLLNLPHFFSSL